jgi:hypothetical protein
MKLEIRTKFPSQKTDTVKSLSEFMNAPVALEILQNEIFPLQEKLYSKHGQILITMITNEFLCFLFWRLSFPVQGPHDRKIWRFGCDGISSRYEPAQRQKIINDIRMINFLDDFGTPGQDHYTLILFLGKKSLSRNARGVDLQECVPVFNEEPDTILVDIENRTVEIQLN